MQALKGFRDFYPELMAQRTHVFSAWRKVAERYGFTEYDGPPLEQLELYTNKSGPEIAAQLYCFEDKGGREVSLRPEMTPTLARMVAARSGSLPKPVKWFSIPQLFRYERNQRGRLREHFQLNVDIVGSEATEADAELLSVALDTQRELGFGEDDVVARVNDRRIVAGVLQTIGLTSEQTAGVYGAIDKFRKVDSEKFRALLAEARVPEAHVDDLHELCKGSVSFRDWFGSRLADSELVEARRAIDAFEAYLELLRDAGFGSYVDVDFSIVRGLAYYTGIVFELYDRKGNERAICGGGRYDNLVASLGGPDMPALGFGMGDVVLSLILEERGKFPEPRGRVDVMVVPVGNDLSREARQITRRIRESDVRADTPYHPRSIGKELGAATQAGAKIVVILGPDEWEDGSVQLKHLDSGEQTTVAIDAVGDEIRRRLD